MLCITNDGALKASKPTGGKVLMLKSEKLNKLPKSCSWEVGALELKSSKFSCQGKACVIGKGVSRIVRNDAGIQAVGPPFRPWSASG